jgi:uncharacterized protein YecT (DUF1311 family)
MAGMRCTREIQFGLLGAVLCVAFSLPAGPQHAKTPDAPCQSAGSENLRTQCFVSYARRAERELEWVLRVIGKGLTASQGAELQTAETYWHSFREANCDAERDLYTETGPADLAYAACAESVTRQRVVELKMIYSWLFK